MTVVAWPPPTPPNTRTNATPLTDAHAADHNKIADALDTLIARLGAPLAYVESTAPLSVSATNFAASHEYITSGPITYDGTPVVIEFFAPSVTAPATTSQAIYVNLADGTATDLGRLAMVANTAMAGLSNAPVFARRRLTPTAGVHTFNVRAYVSSGSSANISAGTGAAITFVPASLRITRA